MNDFLLKFKKPKALVLAGCFAALLWLCLSAYQAGIFRFGTHGSGHSAIDRIIRVQSSPNDALSPLVVLPDDGTAKVVSMIDGAKKSVDLVMYSLDDKDVQSALARAHGRGVSVRVILNGGYQGAPPTKKSTVTFDWLSAHGVPVKWSPPYFALTHQKTLVVDGAEALIMTGNLDRTYYKKDRDFQIADGDANDVRVVEAAFENDWNGQNVRTSDGDDLVWSPGSEPELIALIESAKDSLLVENEEMADVAVENALEDAARRGVDVEVLMTLDVGWLQAFSALAAAGVHIRTFDAKGTTYIHAKIIVSDGKLAFLGSENFSDASLDDNRELGIVLSKEEIVAKLMAVFRADWLKAQDFS